METPAVVRAAVNTVSVTANTPPSPSSYRSIITPMGILREIGDCISTSVAKSVTERKNTSLHPDGRREIRIPLADTGGSGPRKPDHNRAIIIYEPPLATAARDAEPPTADRDVTVCWFHGGGYLVGTPESMAIGADIFNAHGYRFVSMGFGLLGKQRFPSQVEDAFLGVKAVLDWLDDNDIRDRCGRPQGIVLGGNSAGGLSAGMVAYDRESQARYGIDGSRIRGVISLAGVLDMHSMVADAGHAGSIFLRRFTILPDTDATGRYSPIELIGENTGNPNGGNIDEDANSAIRDASISNRPIPILCIHGRNDALVPCSSSIRFAQKLDGIAAGTTTLRVIEDHRYGHIRLTAGIFTEDPASSETLRTIFSWLSRISDAGR